MSDFDLMIIGTGVAGRAAADEAIVGGLRTALIDERDFGGTCALRGCEPKKLLVAGVEPIERIRAQAGNGATGTASLDWRRLIEFKRTMTDPMPEMIAKAYAEQGVTTLHGSASFISPTSLQVGDSTYATEHILVATGAIPMPLGIPGQELVIDSERFMTLDALPERVAFIGGGYISFEFAAMARAAGSEVSILHRGASPLGQFDADIVALLLAQYAELGIRVLLNAPVSGVSRRDDDLVIERGGGTTVDTDLIVHGAGRMPDISRLRLDVANVSHGRQGVVVDEHMRSVSNERVFAAGDAASLGLPLTPVGVAQARIAVANMLHEGSRRFRPSATASVVFSDPPMASVGLGEGDVNAGRLDAEVNFVDTSGWWSSKRVGLHHSGAKTIVDRRTGRVLGAHILGHNADELINVFALAIDRGVTAAELKDVLWGYPTATSEIAYMV